VTAPVRIAAVGDLHAGLDSAGRLRAGLGGLGGRADLLLLAGDLTQRGRVEEAKVLVEELRGVDVPVVAVLGNPTTTPTSRTRSLRCWSTPDSACSRATRSPSR
jgi:Icc-related predicted phosphoesterase